MAQPAWVFRNTASRLGFQPIIHERNSPLRLLRYDRLVLRGKQRSHRWGTESREYGLLCVAGGAEIEVGDQVFRMAQLDGVYLPPGVDARVSALPQADLAIGSAPGEWKRFTSLLICRIPQGACNACS